MKHFPHVKRKRGNVAFENNSNLWVDHCVCSSSTAKVVGTVTPKEPVADWDAAWEFSTGDELRIRLDSSGSISELGLNSRTSSSLVRFFENQ